jgi:hypothetical protein
MKRFIFLLAFFPMFVAAQENKIGGRIAYTHTNKSYNFGFGGISLNTEAIQPRIGISAFNFGQIHFGYSIPFFKKIGFQRFYFYSSIQSVLNLTRSQISVINKSPAFIRRGFII